jgi:hypothetical protein
MERQQTEVGALFSGLAAFFALLAAVLSVWWFHRAAAPAAPGRGIRSEPARR